MSSVATAPEDLDVTELLSSFQKSSIGGVAVDNPQKQALQVEPVVTQPECDANVDASEFTGVSTVKAKDMPESSEAMAMELAILRGKLALAEAKLVDQNKQQHRPGYDLAMVSPPASVVESACLTEPNYSTFHTTSNSTYPQDNLEEISSRDNDIPMGISQSLVQSHRVFQQNSYASAPASYAPQSSWNKASTPAWSTLNTNYASGPPSRQPTGLLHRPRDARPGLVSNSPGFAMNNSFGSAGAGSSADGFPDDSSSNDYRSARTNWSLEPISRLGSPPSFSRPMTPLPFPSMVSLQPQAAYHSRPADTRLCPTALEFSTSIRDAGPRLPVNPWNPRVSLTSRFLARLIQMQPQAEPTSTFIGPSQNLNYRAMLARDAVYDPPEVVMRIVRDTDQQASIFLQQKLKVCTPEHRFELVEAIVAQAYPLMINRFGNFLIQRCFEHGTPAQVIKIANAIRGNTLNLSMDSFGCHVIQKAFDAVPEEYKAIMVHELLRRIPETVIHRYACHVWQKLFELRWSDSPPQIMRYVNEALRGMWHEVALGETGSLVVQNIFENCLEEDKASGTMKSGAMIANFSMQRPCIDEVLISIDIISHGQFGNWCIQHICEHGASEDKNRATQHVLNFATEYSTDQFASKVVEKCLKVGGADFLDRYLARVCEARPGRPRMPLIDSKQHWSIVQASNSDSDQTVAGDQYGNYLIQYILTNAEQEHRELVANQVRYVRDIEMYFQH